MKLQYVRIPAFVLFLVAIFYACNTTEDTVVVVERGPSTQEAAEQDTLDEQFRELTIGLIDSVTNFDPLFAANLSTQRTLSLLYDGLYTLNRQGEPVPSIAGSVEISDDSLEYVFTLNQNKFYHNSPVFTSGVGRRVSAADVKQAFERTAKASVPGTAARLLMGIRGFENYYLEQQSVYDPQKRVLDEVVGIQVIDSQTLGIVLQEKDPLFLEKLASPYLFIYPQEAVNSDLRNFTDHPVGTGTYRLNRAEETGRIVLSHVERRNNGDDDDEATTIHQINLIHSIDDSELLQEFSGRQIDWIPEVSPAISDQVLNENNSLQESYAENYRLITNNADRIAALYLNERATVNHEWLTNRLAYLTNEDFSVRGDITLNVNDFEITEEAEPLDEYYASFTDDANTRRVLTELHNIIFMPESSLSLFDIRVPTRQTSIYTRNSDSIHEEMIPLDNNYWMRIDTRILGLSNNRITGLEPTNVPWLLHVEQLRVQNSGSGIQ